jgi:hypothetical protein
MKYIEEMHYNETGRYCREVNERLPSNLLCVFSHISNEPGGYFEIQPVDDPWMESSEKVAYVKKLIFQDRQTGENYVGGNGYTSVPIVKLTI